MPTTAPVVHPVSSDPDAPPPSTAGAGGHVNGDQPGQMAEPRPLTTTLAAIRACDPCEDGWRKLLAHLGKTSPDDEPLPFETILDSNGLDDALWCCRAAPQYDREWRLFAVWCARRVEHLMTDPRSIAALDVAERFARGEATDADLAAAGEAALEAAWAAAGEPAREAAREAAMELARENARAAAWEAAGDAAGAAAGEAALEAAWAAAGEAALEAAWAAAGEPAREAQSAEFRRIVRGAA